MAAHAHSTRTCKEMISHPHDNGKDAIIIRFDEVIINTFETRTHSEQSSQQK